VLGWSDATSEEFAPKACPPVVVFMPEIDPKMMGGTMRIGQRGTRITSCVNGKKTLAAALYNGDAGALAMFMRSR
jgi:CTP synthase (UTP-ammonia lyase)